MVRRFLLLGGALLLVAGGAWVAHAQDRAKRVEVGPNVFLEVEGKTKRVLVKSSVVLRDGPLEGLLTLTKAKEHEYILATDSDARHIHTALLLAGARAGEPAKFFPKYIPAHGSTIRITLRYKGKDGKMITESAKEWMREAKTKKRFDHDWVFGGSKFVPNPEKGKPPIYLAKYGDIVCVCNMETAMLDLPILSPKTFDARAFEPNPDKVPAKETAVDVIFEVVKK